MLKLRRPEGASRQGGFTIVELMVSLAILAMLAMVALPFAQHTIKRDKEFQLRRALRDIRMAIDAYKAAADAGKIALPIGASGYPASLDLLATGVPNAKVSGQTLYFLRRIPADPFATERGIPAAQTWGLRSYDSSYDAPRYRADVFDVYSQSTEAGLNGVAYKEW
ncbi:type II secretion system protein [Chitinimonas sp.]|uniref:type II secretion system protein n=1 Tax=Chitinimonas sp. TaxID=1934313 RepID=UPI0035B35376